MPLRVGCHLPVQVFLIWITQESRLKPPSQDLPGGGGGALAPI
jgi:hypothetical protein